MKLIPLIACLACFASRMDVFMYIFPVSEMHVGYEGNKVLLECRAVKMIELLCGSHT